MGLSGGGGAEGGGGAVGEPEGAGVSTERVEGGCLRLRVGAGAGAEGGFAAAACMLAGLEFIGIGGTHAGVGGGARLAD